jgi:hypothetical protein
MDLAALRRWWPLAAVIGLLSLAALAATRSTPQLARIERGEEPEPTIPTFGQGATDYPDPAGTAAHPVEGGLPDWAGKASLVVLGVIAAVLLVMVVVALIRDQVRRRDRRLVRRPRTITPTSTTEDLVAALDAGLLDLSDTDLDPRRAVIACWVRLEQAAAAAGTPRHPGDTPTDLVGRLLAEQHVDAAVLAAFAEVYREARYATHTVDDRMRAQARDALQRLRADLSAGATPA